MGAFPDGWEEAVSIEMITQPLRIAKFAEIASQKWK
jgi:hypothetical protein